MTDEIEMVKVRKVGGLARVDIPDGPRGVAVGEVVEVPEERAWTLVDGGEFEIADDDNELNDYPEPLALEDEED